MLSERARVTACSTSWLELQPRPLIADDVPDEVREIHSGAPIDGESRAMSAAEKPGLKLDPSNPG